MILSKSNVNKFIGLFGLTIFLIVLCLISYFILPNNYEIKDDKELKRKKKVIKIKLNDVNVKDDSNIYKIERINIKNKILKFKINETNFNLNYIIENMLKSQNIKIEEDMNLEIYDSDLIIVNNEKYDVTLEIEVFDK